MEEIIFHSDKRVLQYTKCCDRNFDETDNLYKGPLLQ